MSLMDGDYICERRDTSDRIRPFTPPEPRLSGLSTVALAALVLWAAVTGYQWWEKRLRPNMPPAATQPPQPPMALQQRQRSPQLTGDPARQPSQALRTGAPAEPTTVTKCISAGRVTFSDGPCEPGAQATTIAVPKTNVADAFPRVSVQAPRAIPAPEQTIVVERPPVIIVDGPAPTILRQQECAALEQAIANVDAHARQPLSAADQDWLAARRKEYRDRQYRLRC